MDELLCPSSMCVEGAALIGVIDGDGGVNYIKPAPAIDAQFVEIASRSRPPEQKFRFANNCVKSSCSHWIDARCEVVDLAVSAVDDLGGQPSTSPENLPRCAIRPTCRWFAQRGRDACRACPSVFNFQPQDPPPELRRP